MIELVGRSEELAVMRSALDRLSQQREGVESLPIVEYIGPPGVGKTAMHIGGLAIASAERGIPYVDATDLLRNAPNTIEDKLTDGPLAISVELNHIEEKQRELVLSGLWRVLKGKQGPRLFASIASLGIELLPSRSLSRRVATVSLGPLSERAALALLARHMPNAPPEAQKGIIDLVGGHPYALTQLAQATASERYENPAATSYAALQPTINKIIDEKLLAGPNISDEAKMCMRTLLTLFAIPRRSNLVLIREMIEHFAPEYAGESALSYFNIPSFLNGTSPGMFAWDLDVGGFRVHNAVGPILKADIREGSPEQWSRIHKFLAYWNWQVRRMEGMNPKDKLLYGREAIYHSSVVRGATR